MTKTIKLMIISIFIGTILGTILNTNYKYKIVNTINKDNTYYFIQEGVYSSKNLLQENTKDLNTKTVDKKNNKYYVYLGITRNIKIANRIKDIYKKEGYSTYIKEVNLDSEEFYNNVEQFDLLIKDTTDNEEVLTIEQVILANYEEIFKNNY